MAATTSPQTFQQWKTNMNLMINSIVKNKKLPALTEFPFVATNSNDYTEMIKAAVVSGLSFVPEVGSFLSIIVDSIWSHVIANQDQQSELWNSFSLMVKSIVDIELEKYDNDNVNICIADAKSKVNDFYKKRGDYLLKKDAVHKNAVRDSYDDAMDILKTLLLSEGVLRRETYCAQQLAAFTVIATTNLLLLKDGIKNGIEWGLTSETVQQYSAEYDKGLGIYKTHAVKAFRIGCEKIKNTPNISGVEIFKRMMSYRSHCAMYCFDYFNIWDGFNQKDFPNGVYFDNVRYVWTGISGAPVDNSKSVTYEAPYYSNSYEFLEKRFIDNEYDLYRKELKSVEINHSDRWIYGVQEIHRDPSLANGEYVGPLAGNQTVKNGVGLCRSTVFNFPSTASKQTFTSTYDVQPFKISVQTKPNESTTIDIGESLDNSERFTYLNLLRYNKIPNITINGDFENHKIGTIRGGESNSECYTYYSDEGVGSYAGILDSIIVGFIPVNIFNQNYIQKKGSTTVNCQKLWARSSGVSFCRDHYAPTMHSFCIPIDGVMKFRFEFSDTTIQTYSVCIRYHCSAGPAGKILIRNALGTDVGTPVQLSNCTRDGTHIVGNAEYEYCNQYRYSASRNVDFTKSSTKQISLIAKEGPIYIQSVILTPVTVDAA